MTCPICRTDSAYALTRDGCDYFSCPACGFLFHRSATRSVTPDYEHDYWQAEREDARQRERDDAFRRALELIYLSNVPVHNLLDFGCGLGITVEMLRDRFGVNAVGVDPYGEFAENDHLHRVELRDLRATYPQGYFDAILSVEVFEHLEDPQSALRELAYFLNDNGKLLINTGTREFLERHDPTLDYVDPTVRGHISIYSLRTFETLAASVGMRASFLADRTYAVILARDGGSSHPHPANLETLGRLGDWFATHFAEYMRLVDLEHAFAERSAWAVQLNRRVAELEAQGHAAGDKPPPYGNAARTADTMAISMPADPLHTEREPAAPTEGNESDRYAPRFRWNDASTYAFLLEPPSAEDSRPRQMRGAGPLSLWERVGVRAGRRVKRQDLIAAYWQSHPRFRFFKSMPLGAQLLDVGAGNGGLVFWKGYLPPRRDDLRMYAVDRDRGEHFARYDDFQVCDLNSDELRFQDLQFDAVLASHVMEHLRDPSRLLAQLVERLQANGRIYVEVPAEHTKRLPPNTDFLALGWPLTISNFYDDAAHVDTFTAPQLEAMGAAVGLRPLTQGPIEDPYLDTTLVRLGLANRDAELLLYGFWSRTRWAHYIVFEKDITHPNPPPQGGRGREPEG